MGSIINRLMFTEEEKTKMFFQMLNRSENDIVIRFKYFPSKFVLTYDYDILHELHQKMETEGAEGYYGNLFINVVGREEYRSIITSGSLQVDSVCLRVKSVDFHYEADHLIKWRLYLYSGNVIENGRDGIMLENEYFSLHKRDDDKNNNIRGSFIKLDEETNELYLDVLLFNTELIKDIFRKSMLAMTKLKERKR